MKDLRQSVSEDARLRLPGGAVIRSVVDLRQQLGRMNSAVFRRFLGRKAFVTWVRTAYHDSLLAAAFRRAKTPADMIAAIDRRLRETRQRVETRVQQAPRLRTVSRRVSRPQPQRVVLPPRTVHAAPGKRKY